MEEEFEEYNEEGVKGLVERFELTLNAGHPGYFDVEEFEEIIDFYDYNQNTNRLEIALRTATDIHPHHISFRIRQAQRLSANKRYNKAAKLLEKLLDIEPNNFLVRQSLAHVYSRLKKHDKAIKCYLETIELGANAIDLWMNIAYEYESLGSYNTAVEYLKRVLESDKEDETEDDGALYEILFCYEMINEHDKSVAFFQSWVDNHPYSKVAWFNLGISYSNLELFEKAIEAYDFTTAIDETFASAYFNKANALINLKQYNEAIVFFKETFRYEQADGVTYMYIGQCYEHMDDLDNAIRNYMQAVDINDRLAEAWVNIGMVYEKLDNYKKALPFILEAVKVEPENIEFQYLLGDAYVELEEYEKALTIYKFVAEKKPENKDIWYDLAGVLWKKGEVIEAQETLEKGLLVDKNNCKIRFRQFEFAYEQGRVKIAYQYISQAMEIDTKLSVQLISEIALLNSDEVLLDLIEEFQRKEDNK